VTNDAGKKKRRGNNPNVRAFSLTG
jgi:hypothetical protein